MIGRSWSQQICPKCGHLYVDWLNYEDFAR